MASRDEKPSLLKAWSRWRPESTVCVVFFITAAAWVHCSLSFLRHAPLASHIGAISLSCVFVMLQYHFLPTRLSEVSVRSCLLGHVAGLGTYTAASGGPAWMFGVYLVILAWFHGSEYLFASLFCPHACSKKSFILNHSPAYIVATLVSWLEFVAFQAAFPNFRSCSWVSLLGLIMCLVGEIFRKLAIGTAAESFNHVIEEYRRKDHTLVTHGVYSFCRHPSYLGWWIFAVGTQVLLQNPLCAIAYFLGARHFFADRVQYEEERLVHFFGQAYRSYRRKVPLRMPFIDDPADDMTSE